MGVRELTVGVNAPNTEREAVGTTKAWEHDWKHPTATAAVAAMEGRFRRPLTLDFWKQTGAMVSFLCVAVSSL